MTGTNERQALCELADETGWERLELDRIDVYKKGVRGVEVIFTEDRLAGGTLFEDLRLLTHTREVATVEGWLKK
jgi:hypothetical protein